MENFSVSTEIFGFCLVCKNLTMPHSILTVCSIKYTFCINFILGKLLVKTDKHTVYYVVHILYILYLYTLHYNMANKQHFQIIKLSSMHYFVLKVPTILITFSINYKIWILLNSLIIFVYSKRYFYPICF